jgi:TRAP-type C4-dicarboxylate transport system permease small subunit
MAKKVSLESLGFLRRMVDHVTWGLALAGMWLIVAMALLILADVSFRAFNRPLVGVFEITELLLSICTFSAIGYAWMVDRHVRVTLLLERFGPRMRAGLDAGASLIGAGLFALIAWRNMIMGIFSFKANDITWLLRIPIYPVYILIVLGSALLTIQMLITCGLSIEKMVKRDRLVT